MPWTQCLVGLFMALAAILVGCSGKSPTAPSPASGINLHALDAEPMSSPGVAVRQLEIEVPPSFAPDRSFLPFRPFPPALILAPGSSVQLTARGHLLDGTTRDVTQEARWELSPVSGVASATGGLIRAQRHGMDTLTVAIGSRDNLVWTQKQLIVMPEGTFVLQGRLRDAHSGQSISGATVSVGTDPLATTTSRHDGSYLVTSVPRVAEVTASMPGYRNKVQQITLADHNSQLDFALEEETPLTRLAGSYVLTLAADPNCSIEGKAYPDELRLRTYQAAITQFGNELTVKLSGATFHPDSWATFKGRISPESTTFWLHAGYWYTSVFDGDVLEQPWPETVLTIAGRATISTSSLVGGMDGSFAFKSLDEPSTSNGSICTSPNHRFQLSR